MTKVTDLCTDCTGVLTKNVLEVTQVSVNSCLTPAKDLKLDVDVATLFQVACCVTTQASISESG